MKNESDAFAVKSFLDRKPSEEWPDVDEGGSQGLSADSYSLTAKCGGEWPASGGSDVRRRGSGGRNNTCNTTETSRGDLRDRSILFCAILLAVAMHLLGNSSTSDRAAPDTASLFRTSGPETRLGNLSCTCRRTRPAQAFFSV